jgi:hypothetical protein
MATREMAEVVGLGVVSIWADNLFWLTIRVLRSHFPVWTRKWLGTRTKEEGK